MIGDNLLNRPECLMVHVSGKRAGFIVIPQNRITPEACVRFDALRKARGQPPITYRWRAFSFKYGHQWNLGWFDTEQEARAAVAHRARDTGGNPTRKS